MMPAAQDAPATAVGISGISLILDFGPGHALGHGERVGHYSQEEVVDRYAATLAEELDCGWVRTHPIETRKTAYRYSFDERIRMAPTNFVPLVLTSDHYARPRLHNSSTIEFSGHEYLGLATRLCEALSEWGRCYVWGHRVSRPVVVNGAPKPYICIKPFALNGPNAEDYLQRLDLLGTTLGRSIGEYLLERNQGRTRTR